MPPLFAPPAHAQTCCVEQCARASRNCAGSAKIPARRMHTRCKRVISTNCPAAGEHGGVRRHEQQGLGDCRPAPYATVVLMRNPTSTHGCLFQPSVDGGNPVLLLRAL